jgi:hypothetical protein
VFLLINSHDGNADADDRRMLKVRTMEGGHKKWHGRAIAKAVSRWFPTAAARVRSRVWKVGFVVDKVASGQVFSEY